MSLIYLWVLDLKPTFAAAGVGLSHFAAFPASAIALFLSALAGRSSPMGF
ncbi:MAG: hypothetical protein LCH91_14095 [Bacteroidetes bacterium]|nr:hypothetical protein [Bacteroidota bacterium]